MPVTSQNQEKFNDYEGFVEKFKPKRTTDDCYTPPHIYDAISNWACDEYGIDPSRIVRPFYPGGDYRTFDYPTGAVVLDNPPFSIISKIIACSCNHFSVCFGVRPVGGLTVFCCGLRRRPSGV